MFSCIVSYCMFRRVSDSPCGFLTGHLPSGHLSLNPPSHCIFAYRFVSLLKYSDIHAQVVYSRLHYSDKTLPVLALEIE